MLQQFQFQDHEIRFIDGKPVANDVASVLGYASPKDAVYRHVGKEYKGGAVLQTPGGDQEMVVLEEPGIYQLIFKSKLPMAKEFQKWVFEEVLPSIRKTGSYSIEPKVPQTYIEALEAHLQSEKDKLALQAEVEKQKALIERKDKTIETQQDLIVEWHPLVKNYKQFMDTEGLISMSEASRMLPNTGRNRLIKVLRLLGILMPNKTEPYQKYMKHFRVKVKVRDHASSDGTYKADTVTLFTPSGFNSILKTMIRKVGEDTLMSYLEKPTLLEAELLEEKKQEQLVKSEVTCSMYDVLDAYDEEALF